MNPDHAVQVQNHLVTRKIKGYATERTMKRAMSTVLDCIARLGLIEDFRPVTIESGCFAGRIAPVLMVTQGTVSPEVVAFAWSGVLVFQPK